MISSHDEVNEVNNLKQDLIEKLEKRKKDLKELSYSAQQLNTAINLLKKYESTTATDYLEFFNEKIKPLFSYLETQSDQPPLEGSGVTQQILNEHQIEIKDKVIEKNSVQSSNKNNINENTENDNSSVIPDPVTSQTQQQTSSVQQQTPIVPVTPSNGEIDGANSQQPQGTNPKESILAKLKNKAGSLKDNFDTFTNTYPKTWRFIKWVVIPFVVANVIFWTGGVSLFPAAAAGLGYLATTVGVTGILGGFLKAAFLTPVLSIIGNTVNAIANSCSGDKRNGKPKDDTNAPSTNSYRNILSVTGTSQQDDLTSGNKNTQQSSSTPPVSTQQPSSTPSERRYSPNPNPSPMSGNIL